MTVAEEFNCMWSDDCSWIDVVLSPYTDLLGDPTVGMVTAAVVVLAFYIYNNDLAMPTVITLLLGGFWMSVVPGDIQQVGFGFLVVGGAAGAMEVWRRYVL
ncbi:hypothetical protein [Natronorubrum halophilum]|uniref:hypothetical protein n=1 Tax=Natronorubrum halophilum TaxID=1702106 RepID=UPI0013CEAA49|nr:hypothetical protein [Natronorubrum halophilum]